MASWATHIAISFALSSDPYFLFGSIAPDFWNGSGYSREFTHYQSKMYAPIAYRQLASEINRLDHGKAILSRFLKGYLCHLVTDCIWLRDIYMPIFGFESGLWQNSEDAQKAKEEEMPKLDSYMANAFSTEDVENILESLDLTVIPVWSWVRPDLLSNGLKALQQLLSSIEAQSQYRLMHISEVKLNAFIADSKSLAKEFL